MIYAKTKVVHRVRHADTDDWGIGYYGNYFRWYEAARTELLRKIGLSPKDMEETHGTIIPVVEAKNNYFLPVKFDDELLVEASLTEIGNTHFRVDYLLLRGKEKLAQGYTVHVFTDRKMKKKNVPEKMEKLKVKK